MGGIAEVAATSTGIPRHVVVSWDIVLPFFQGDELKHEVKLQAAVATALEVSLGAVGFSDWTALALSDPSDESDAWPSDLKNLLQVNLQRATFKDGGFVTESRLACAISVRPRMSKAWKDVLQEGHLGDLPGLVALKHALMEPTFVPALAKQLKAAGAPVEEGQVQVSDIQASTPSGRQFWSTCSDSPGSDNVELAQGRAINDKWTVENTQWREWGGLFAAAALAGGSVGLAWWWTARKDGHNRAHDKENVPLMAQQPMHL